MNTLLKTIFAFLLLSSTCAQAFGIVPGHSGSWYDPNHSGHGLSVEVLGPETLVLNWSTYHPDGTPMWLVAVADIEGDTASGAAYHYAGMHFGSFDSLEMNEESWGELSVTFLGCDHARLSYDSPMTYDGVPFGAGEIDLVRLTYIDGLHCTTLEPGHFGTFSTGFGSDDFETFVTNHFVWILPDGALAYQWLQFGTPGEIGFGKLTMTGEDTFEYEATTSNGTRQGTGWFEESRVTLDLGAWGLLSVPRDPMSPDAVTLEDLAGDYSGPDAIFGASVDETGAYTILGLGGIGTGRLTIPEAGFNLLADRMEFTTDDGEVLVNRGIGVHHEATGFLVFIYNREDGVWAMPWFGGD